MKFIRLSLLWIKVFKKLNTKTVLQTNKQTNKVKCKKMYVFFFIFIFYSRIPTDLQSVFILRANKKLIQHLFVFCGKITQLLLLFKFEVDYFSYFLIHYLRERYYSWQQRKKTTTKGTEKKKNYFWITAGGINWDRKKIIFCCISFENQKALAYFWVSKF